MTVLLTNDDGIEAPGMAAMREAVESLGFETVTVAPDRHLSGCSHQATTSRPLTLAQVAAGSYALDGSPVDCTRVGLAHLALQTKWVLSGVNEGGNLGADVYLSGTVAAAREACLLGQRAIAVSQYVRRRPLEWRQTRDWTRHVLELLFARTLAPGCFWNVNLPQPDEAWSQPPPCVFCHVDPQPLPVRYELCDGKLHYRARYQDRLRTARHDVEIRFSGHITISEISLLPPALLSE